MSLRYQRACWSDACAFISVYEISVLVHMQVRMHEASLGGKFCEASDVKRLRIIGRKIAQVEDEILDLKTLHLDSLGAYRYLHCRTRVSD